MPELLVTIFGLKEASFGVRLLKFMEKLSIGFADHVLTVNQACKDIFSARSCAPEKIQVLMNVPDERVFSYQSYRDYPERDPARPFIVMSHGSIVERNGLDIAVEALRLLRASVPDAELWVYGASTPFLQGAGSGRAQRGRQRRPLFWRQDPEGNRGGDPGLRCGGDSQPQQRLHGDQHPHADFEYLALGKPVVSPKSKGITDYFGPEEMVYFELGDAASLARQLESVSRNPAWARAVTGRGQQVYQGQAWSAAREKFLDCVVQLLGPKRKPRP